MVTDGCDSNGLSRPSWDEQPMWTATTRAQHKRDGLRFASDVTDAEWALIEPLLPPPSPIGRPPDWPMREIVNAIFYRPAFRRIRRSMVGSRPGATPAYGSRSHIIWSCRTEHVLDARPALLLR